MKAIDKLGIKDHLKVEVIKVTSRDKKEIEEDRAKKEEDKKEDDN